MRELDTRDANTLMAEVSAEFRRACEAQRDFLDWYRTPHEATFAEWLRRYSETVAECEPWAASYELDQVAERRFPPPWSRRGTGCLLCLFDRATRSKAAGQGSSPTALPECRT